MDSLKERLKKHKIRFIIASDNQPLLVEVSKLNEIKKGNAHHYSKFIFKLLQREWNRPIDNNLCIFTIKTSIDRVMSLSEASALTETHKHSLLNRCPHIKGPHQEVSRLSFHVLSTRLIYTTKSFINLDHASMDSSNDFQTRRYKY